MSRIRSALNGAREKFRKFCDGESVKLSLARIRRQAKGPGGEKEASERYQAYVQLLSKNRIPDQNWPLKENVNDFYYHMPLDPNKILMLGLGKNVRGNLQVILKELNTKDAFRNFQIYVRTSEETDENVRAFIEKNGWSRTKTVTKDREYGRLMATAKILITEVYFPNSWVKRQGQISINLWHGTPIKKLGAKKEADTCHRNGPAQRNFINADYLLYPNEFTRERLQESYRVSQLMNGRALMLGYPRTGEMLALPEEERQSLRKRLAPEGEKMYVYMPTFRDYLSASKGLALFKGLLDYLEEQFSDGEILYVNLHHKFNGVLNYENYTKIRPFPTDLDSYQVLAVSDALISDYSSVIFDYLALRKQIILYIPDYETYLKKRGVYLDIRSLPFDEVSAKEEVLAALHAGKRYDDTDAFERFCPYDSCGNAEKLCRLILGEESSLTLKEIPKNDLPSVLIHTELAPLGERTELLHELTKGTGPKDYNLFFSCSRTDLKAQGSGAYPMFRDYPVIGSDLDPRLCSVTRALLDLYRKGRLSFQDVLPMLLSDYRMMGKRMVGEASFSAIAVYDCADVDRILALASLEALLLLFFTTELLDLLETGDEYSREAIRYAAKVSSGIFAFSEEERARAEALLGSGIEKRVSVITSAQELDELLAGTIGEKR